MPRRLKLTWQPGAGARPGRWKKVYRGRTLYLGTGKCKSDHASYKKALDTFRVAKLEIDAEQIEAPRPHQQAYEEGTDEWERVLRWSVDHGDDQSAVMAREKLKELRRRAELTAPPAVTANDRLWSR